ncbi:MAG TPA: DNA mismatch repair protein MutS, partial [Alphaproteobacteria bacterium]|nr:DNA mismatch repair protein MutS [Alphaproteobacteria bacterium]
MTRDEPNAGLAGSRSPDESKSEARSTPMMAQYFEIKNAHPDSLLFFRMGDFYEMFFDDAVAAAGVLNIALTKRGKHDGADVPMCGVPVHSHQAYLQRLIKEGFRVAICEQTEDPAEARRRGGKALVKRAVDRLVTPGTLTEDTLLDARSNNHLAAVARAGGEIALAWIDISTGVFWVTVPAQGDLAATLSQISPGELLVPDSLVEDSLLGTSLMDWRALLTPLPATRFDSIAGERRLKRTFRVASLDAFGAFGRA